MNEYSWIPIRLYLWTLKFEFHIIVTSHEILFFCDFFQSFKNVNVRTILGMAGRTKTRLDVPKGHVNHLSGLYSWHPGP